MLSSGRLTQRRQYILFFALVVGVAVAGYLVGHPRGRSAGIVDAVPRGAWLVVTVDVAAVRSSPIAQPLLSAGVGTSLPGLGSLSDACGFDPLTRMKELLVASPENGDSGDFGLAFTGDFTRDELARCAEKAIRARGGTPATSTHGAFTTVEDTADAKHARVAYREGGPFLVGRGAWLDAMIDGVEGRREGPGPEHSALRAALAPKPGSPAQAIVLTALLPTALREKLKGELGAELGSEADKAYVSVLAVSQAGIALGTGGAGSTTELLAELRCETPAACEEVKALVGRKRLAFSRELGVRLLGLGPLLDSLKVDTSGPALSASARAPTDDLARAVQRALDFKGIGHAQGHPAPGVPPGPPVPAPAPSAP
jgi:hypothetical protein